MFRMMLLKLYSHDDDEDEHEEVKVVLVVVVASTFILFHVPLHCIRLLTVPLWHPLRKGNF
jgi:hypothetical protein